MEVTKFKDLAVIVMETIESTAHHSEVLVRRGGVFWCRKFFHVLKIRTGNVKNAQQKHSIRIPLLLPTD